MSLQQIIIDTIAQVETCLAETCNEYVFLISAGAPPAACSSIGIYPAGSAIASESRAGAGIGRCHTLLNETMRIMVTRCCESVDGSVEWTPEIDQAAMLCLVRDIERILECLECNLHDFLQDTTICPEDNARISRVQWDTSVQGQCYSAAIDFTYQRKLCCPPVV